MDSVIMYVGSCLVLGCVAVWGGGGVGGEGTCGRFAQRGELVPGVQICLLAPALHSVHISTDLPQTHLYTHTRYRRVLQYSRMCFEAGGAVQSYWFTVRVLPQVSVAVAGGSQADVVLMRGLAAQTAVTTGTLFMDRLQNTQTVYHHIHSLHNISEGFISSRCV